MFNVPNNVLSLHGYRSSSTNETNLFAPPIERNADSVPLDPPRPNSRAQEAVETENTATASWFAPSRALSPQTPGGGNLLTGKLRVILEGEDTPPTYIWGGLSKDGTDSKSRVDFKRTTLNVSDALIVNFKPYNEPHSICCVVCTPSTYRVHSTHRYSCSRIPNWHAETSASE